MTSLPFLVYFVTSDIPDNHVTTFTFDILVTTVMTVIFVFIGVSQNAKGGNGRRHVGSKAELSQQTGKGGSHSPVRQLYFLIRGRPVLHVNGQAVADGTGAGRAENPRLSSARHGHTAKGAGR